MSLIKRLFGGSKPSKEQSKTENTPKSRSRESKCPYCDALLEKKPARKTKCPHCGNHIFVRRGRLLTEDQKLVEEWLDRLGAFGITRQAFNQHREQLAEQFGFQPSVNDTVWRVLNLLVASTADHSQAKILYNEMVHLVRSEGKDPKPYLVEAAKHELLSLKESGVVSRVRVNTVNDGLVCSKCRALAEKTFTIEQALNDMPIPNACESEDGCRCWYSPVVDF
ncbi:MAG: hypothetical protein SWK90_08250 [Chloroflexota bacterium]|nr:hypothetical protein [Chloroflexota bacterium]